MPAYRIADITDRTLAEEELRKRRERLATIVAERTEELKKTNGRLRREIDERERMEEEFIKAQKLSGPWASLPAA